MLHWTHTNTPNGTSIGSAVSTRLIDVPNTQTGNTRQTRVATAGCAYMQCMLNYAYCAAQATCRPIHGLIAACTCWCHAWTTDKSKLARDCSCSDFAWQISCLSLHRLQCVSQVAGQSPLVFWSPETNRLGLQMNTSKCEVVVTKSWEGYGEVGQSNK